MSVTKDLREGNLRAWGLLISIILVILAFILPLHTASKEITLENDKTTYTAGVFNVHLVHKVGSTILYDRMFLYSELTDVTGFDNAYIQYLSYLLPALLLLVLLLFLYEFFKGDVYGRGKFHVLGVILLFVVIASFVALYGAFLTYEWGCGFWLTSRGIITVIISEPDWGFWCLLIAFIISLITAVATKETLKLLLPKFKKR
jgi:hypothetical protein